MTDWENVNENWKEITDIYEELFNIPRHIIEYVAVHDSLLLCTSGKSNKSVAELQGTTEDLVEGDCVEFLGFDGWNEDLDVNPLFIYHSVFGNYTKFIGRCDLESSKMTLEQIEQSFVVCKAFVEMEKQIDDYYY